MNMHAVPLMEDEIVTTIIRRHWFHIAVRGIGIILMYTLIASVVVLGDSFIVHVVGGSFRATAAVSTYLLAALALVFWMRFFATWSNYWLDAWIITNRRIIVIEQITFFRREVSSFPIERIQDVTYDIAGIIAMWLHFGDVRIQTASISSNLVMRQVPFPEEVKEVLMQTLSSAAMHANRR